MRLAFLAAAWLGGVLIGLEIQMPPAPLLLLLGGSISMGLALGLRRLSVFPAVLAVMLLLGAWRADSGSAPLLPLASQGTAKVAVEGRISGDPEFSGGRVKFTLDLSAADLGSGLVPVANRILVYAHPPDDLVARRSPPYFEYGDLVNITGALRRPEPFGGFDYPAYLASQGMTGIMLADSATVTGATGGWREWPYALRGRLSESIEATIPYPQSALGQALLLGLRGDLPPEMVQDFRSTGTSHLLAISGLHVGVLVVMFLSGAAWLFGRRGLYFLLAPMLMIWAYALVSGLPPSVVRAAVMGSVYLLAVAVGRPGSVLPALALSAGVMTAVSPEIIQRVSFQLSFAAVGGIALAQSLVPQWSFPAGSRDQNWWQTWTYPLLRALSMGLIISLAATLATWPLVAFNFREVALLGVIVTVLALPAMPFIMVGTLVAAVLGSFSVTVGQFFGWLVWAPMSYLIELVEAAPGWTIETNWAGVWLVWVWYAVLAGLLLLLTPGRVARLWGQLKDGTRVLTLHQRGPEPRPEPGPARTVPIMFGAVLMAAVAVVLWWQVGTGGDGNLHVYFFDVGQGDSALIVTPGGRQLLVDGGPETDSAIRALSGAMSGSDRSLDLVVMTHLDADHSRGLLEVLDRYQVGAVLAGTDSPGSAMYAQWQAGVERNRVDVVPVHRGYRLDLGSGVAAEVLNPRPGPYHGASGSEPGNNESVVLRLTYGSISFLLTADIEAESEDLLEFGGAGIQSTVLKVAHHGSKTSSTAGFVAAVGPAAALISVGSSNSYGHPNAEVLGRLLEQTGSENLYRTDWNGDVEFVTDGTELWVNTER